MRVLFIFFLCSFAAERSEQWYVNVEESVASLAIGPLKATFRPEDLGRRTREGALASQANRLRAKVVSYTLDSTSSFVRVCPFDNTSKQAIKMVIDDFRNKTFDIHWLRTKGQCGHHDGYLHVVIPPPASGATE